MDTITDKAWRLDSVGKYDEALDVIFKHFDALHRAANFEESNRLLDAIDVKVFSIDSLVGFLSITLPAKSNLPSRPTFFSRVKESIESRGRKTDKLLKGLK